MDNRFIEGYKACLADMEVMLNASIRRNDGARTFKDCYHVMNDVIVFSHTQEMRLDADVEQINEAVRKVFVLGGM